MTKSLIALIFFLAPGVVLVGSHTYSTPGSYSFTVPTNYGTLTVEVWGGGGGGGGRPFNSSQFTPGGNSSFGSVVANGGGGASANGTTGLEYAGIGGNALGGDVNAAH